MTMSGYSNAVVDVMLGWLKGFANWVLRLFNLAGSARTSPLLWLSHNWLKLLIFFLVLGVVLDRLIWLIRWRPYWVWFRKERIIVNDDKFFAGADLDPDGKWDDDLDRNWNEQDYVVASTVVKRRDGEKSRGAVVKDGKRPAMSGASKPRSRVARHAASGERTDRRRAGSDAHGKARPAGGSKRRRADEARPHNDFFGVDLKRPDVSDFYEDEVFNVSNLPVSDEFDAEGHKKTAAK